MTVNEVALKDFLRIYTARADCHNYSSLHDKFADKNKTNTKRIYADTFSIK